ncbi:MAG: ATP-dependent helicase HrpB [Nitrospira sp.]|nr:ATP-dependent helicase HrpB [Nitrospira sp.]
MSDLPIEDALPALRDTLLNERNALLTAPPGAGKTTRVPLALLDAPWLHGKKLLMLEPRRLAARAAAHRMAATLHEPVGATVGYRMRLDTKVGPATRIEVVTDGILTRLFQHDPELADYAAVIFDEFHERSLQADTGLALALETQKLFRPDLRLLVMSATLDCGPVGDLLRQAPTIRCDGRMFPVDTCYLDHPLTDRLDMAVTHTIRRALARDQGSVLVFLPGMAEIRRVERLLRDSALSPQILITPLHGDLPQQTQDAAIAPARPGTRKVVLATSIAETSLTIEGIRIVIDAGLLRVPRFDPRSGLTRLETIRITQDSAEQRRGRAGRLEPGICYRLWTESEQAGLAPRRPPEILHADLAPLLLDLAHWGTADPSELSWLNAPPAGPVAQARDLLIRLGALEPSGGITPHGRRMAEYALHPRLSHMLVRALTMQCAELACDLAALLGERDLLRGPSFARHADIRTRLDALRGERHQVMESTIDRGTLQRVKDTAAVWKRQLIRSSDRSHATGETSLDEIGPLLALAYPDRIAQRQPGTEARYLLTNGRGALFIQPDPLASEPYLVIADLDAGSQWGRIDLAVPISRENIEHLYGHQIVTVEAVVWDEQAASVRASRQRRLGSLVLSEEGLSRPNPAMITAALLDGVRRAGVDTLAWTAELRQWRARVQFLRRIDGLDPSWPDLSDAGLLQSLEEWLGSNLHGMTTLDRVQRVDLTHPLQSLLTREQRRDLDRLAPTHYTVPSGSNIRIEYDTADQPVLAVRLQEMFGCKVTPRIAGGKVPLLLHLLSPAKRPVQITQDLAGFWTGSYHDVRKELRGRYPKHHWPDDPLTAPPTAKSKRPRH